MKRPRFIFGRELIERMAALITAAFGLVAALAWNGAIKGVFDRVFDSPDSLLGMISHAVVVTIIAVGATLWVSRLAERARRRDSRPGD